MASSILNSDDGVISGSSGLKSTGGDDGVLNIQNNGTTAVTVNASGNVGIGTTTALSPLTALGTSSTVSNPASTRAPIASIRGGNNNNRFEFYVDNSGATSVMGLGAYNTAGGATAMTFYTGVSVSEAMRITSSGELAIGSAGGAANALSLVGAATLCLMKNTSATDGTARTTILFRDNGDNTRGSITVSTSGTVYNTTSDYRLKENIAPMTGALEKISLLNPVTYTWKETGDAGQGFVAHELQQVFPDAVTGEKDAVEIRAIETENGTEEKEFIVPQGIDTSFLVATLTAAIQELKAINDAQATRIETLEAKVAALEGQ